MDPKEQQQKKALKELIKWTINSLKLALVNVDKVPVSNSIETTQNALVDSLIISDKIKGK
jgi:hypothetical protein